MKSLMKRDYLQEFQKAFSGGIESITQAAAIYVEAIDENPNLVNEFQEKFKDWIPVSAWAGFEAVGRKWMHPRLLMGGGGRYANRIKRLPYSMQAQIFDGARFELLTVSGEVLNVDVREVTPEQAEQLLASDHIRNLGEQRAHLESRKQTDSVEAETMPYVVSDGRVTFRRGTILSRQELKRILQEM